MIRTPHQIFIIRKKKLPEPLNDFDSDEDNDGDNKTYQEKMWELTDKRKVNSTAIIFSIRAGPNSRLFVPFISHGSYTYCASCFKGRHY